jgi:hypothetical protein
MADLVVLCARCHGLFHVEMGEYPPPANDSNFNSRPIALQTLGNSANGTIETIGATALQEGMR